VPLLTGLTAYVHVADVQRSVDFYAKLGLELRSRHDVDGALVWALVTSEAGDMPSPAQLMLAQADGPVDADAQAVLFYCWTEDVAALRERLLAAGVEVGPVERPFYMPAGEVRIFDPDGYVLLVGQRS